MLYFMHTTNGLIIPLSKKGTTLLKNGKTSFKFMSSKVTINGVTRSIYISTADVDSDLICLDVDSKHHKWTTPFDKLCDITSMYGVNLDMITDSVNLRDISTSKFVRPNMSESDILPKVDNTKNTNNESSLITMDGVIVQEYKTNITRKKADLELALVSLKGFFDGVTCDDDGNDTQIFSYNYTSHAHI